MSFDKLTIADLFEIIQSEDNKWQGTDNGDTVAAYQGRQCFVYAAALILAGRELVNDEAILTRRQAETVFYDFLKYLLHPEAIEGTHGNSRFCPETMLNLWKVKFSSRNMGLY
jgi:hypothetical protein